MKLEIPVEPIEAAVNVSESRVDVGDDLFSDAVIGNQLIAPVVRLKGDADGRYQ